MSYEEKIKEQAGPYLNPGERIVSAFLARPRGSTTARSGGLAAGAIGGKKVADQRAAAANAGLQLASPMALALTDQRLLVLETTPPLAMGKGGDVKGLASAVPLADVESIQVKRLLVGKTVTVTVRGASFKLEVGPGSNPKPLADHFAQCRSAAG